VWINGHYLGSFWDEEKQQSILIPAEILAEKGNRIVVFDLKNNDPGATMRLSDKPICQKNCYLTHGFPSLSVLFPVSSVSHTL
jgi:hypothetical protein